ncbi:MAG: hypothetical protein CBC42_07860 [Betaproteobacteria bacterium TMED82]|nr:MAG: hypothetical protein CBC42_07860 [Betaproteobacteria bacterium TMED82]
MSSKSRLVSINNLFLIFSVINLMVSVLVMALIAHQQTPQGQNSILYAVNIQQLHSLVLLILSLLLIWYRLKIIVIASFFFVIGIIFFSINIYLSDIFNIRFFSGLTPLGGLSLIVGWLTFLIFSLCLLIKRDIRELGKKLN